MQLLAVVLTLTVPDFAELSEPAVVKLIFPLALSVVMDFLSLGLLIIVAGPEYEKLPDLPNMESLVTVFGPKLDIVYWQAIFAPAGTPDAIIKTLNTALQDAVSDPAIAKAWAAQDVTPFPAEQRTPAAADAFLRSEIARWGEVIRDNDIHVDQ